MNEKTIREKLGIFYYIIAFTGLFITTTIIFGSIFLISGEKGFLPGIITATFFISIITTFGDYFEYNFIRKGRLT